MSCFRKDLEAKKCQLEQKHHLQSMSLCQKYPKLYQNIYGAHSTFGEQLNVTILAYDRQGKHHV